jgi:parvulin-like peptidyl-prolyl isomerase
MPSPARWLREPLLHFIVAGTILFAIFAWYRGGFASADDDSTIVVDRRNLLTFLQYRANAFEEQTFGTALDSMSDEEIAQVVDAYVDEEVLYRQAKALGLEGSDNVIRQRMIQKMKFLLQDAASTGKPPDDTALDVYFRKNIDAYEIQPWATFTHVFFDSEKRGVEGARMAAEAALEKLNAESAGFNDATAMGDSFPFLRNYVDRTFEYIASHFGYEFVAELEQAQPSETRWQGPFQSVYGWHVVMLTESAERTYPTLDEVRDDVERDYETERTNAALAKLTESIRNEYTVEVRDLHESATP